MTGLLLMYLREEEEAFWALIALTNTKYQMHGECTSKYNTYVKLEYVIRVTTGETVC